MDQVRDVEYRPRTQYREHPLTPMAFTKSPSTANPALAVPTKRAAVAVADPHSVSIFYPDTLPETDFPSRRIVRGYHNLQSEEARDWPKGGLRHVQPVHHADPVRGVRAVQTPCNSQHLCVVGVCSTPPTVSKQSIRCGPNAYGSNPNSDVTMKKILDRQEIDDSSASFETKKKMGNHALGDTEKFIVTVSDHVQRRNGGVSGFFVALCRDLVSPASPNPSLGRNSDERGKHQPVSWLQPHSKPLVLQRCHHQLTSLTGMQISMLQLASIFWDMEGSEGLDDGTLGALEVTFQTFSTAFGDHPKSLLQSSQKI